LSQAIAGRGTGQTNSWQRSALARSFVIPRLLHFALIYPLISNQRITRRRPSTCSTNYVSELMGTKVSRPAKWGASPPSAWVCAIAAASVWPGLAMADRLPPHVLRLAIAARHRGRTQHILPCCHLGTGHRGPLPGDGRHHHLYNRFFGRYSHRLFWRDRGRGGIATINALGNVGGFVAPTVKTWVGAALRFPPGSVSIFSLLAGLLAAALLVGLRNSLRHVSWLLNEPCHIDYRGGISAK